MLAEPLLALNETITAPSPAKEKAVNYRVLLPKAATLTLLWQAGEKKESRTAFTVALYDENDLTKAIISYDLALNPGQQMSYPLPLTAGIYYVSVTAKTSAAVQYTISLKAEENARIESESNNTSDEADQVELNAAYTAGLLNSADVDFFVFELTEPGKVSVTLNGNDEGKKQNRYQLTVYDAA